MGKKLKKQLRAAMNYNDYYESYGRTTFTIIYMKYNIISYKRGII